VPFKGNAIFSSKNAFAKLTLSRRDDIISLMYFLVYLIDTKQAWIDFSKDIAQQFGEIRRYKIKTKAKDFLTKKTMILLPFASYAYDLEFEERPDYEKLKFFLRKIIMQ
jgi:hypothetical protein